MMALYILSSRNISIEFADMKNVKIRFNSNLNRKLYLNSPIECFAWIYTVLLKFNFDKNREHRIDDGFV